MSRAYEALMIFRVDGSGHDGSRSTQEVEGVIKKLGGLIERSESMGRRKLAFRLAKQGEGYYHLFRFTAPPAQVRELDRVLRLKASVLRFMILTGVETGAP